MTTKFTGSVKNIKTVYAEMTYTVSQGTVKITLFKETIGGYPTIISVICNLNSQQQSPFFIELGEFESKVVDRLWQRLQNEIKSQLNIELQTSTPSYTQPVLKYKTVDASGTETQSQESLNVSEYSLCQSICLAEKRILENSGIIIE